MGVIILILSLVIIIYALIESDKRYYKARITDRFSKPEHGVTLYYFNVSYTPDPMKLNDNSARTIMTKTVRVSEQVYQEQDENITILA